MAASSPVRVAVIGAGVSGAYFTRSLLQASASAASPSIAVTVFEMGRGPGGRCSVRKSTKSHLNASTGINMAITHGAPAFEARSAWFRNEVEQLVASGVLRRFDGTLGNIRVGEGRAGGNPVSIWKHELYSGGAGGGEGSGGKEVRNRTNMDDWCGRLVEGAELRFKEQVQSITRTGNGLWHLSGKDDKPLGEFDWLVATSFSMGHSRWTETFGTPPPLEGVRAAVDSACPPARTTAHDNASSAPTATTAEGDKGELADEAVRVRAVLDGVAAVGSRPVVTLMAVLPPEKAAAWTAFPFDMAHVHGCGTIAKIVIQRLPVAGGEGGQGSDGDGGNALQIVAHSTHDFARRHVDARGSQSAASQLTSAQLRERGEALQAGVVGEMHDALAAAVAPWVPGMDLHDGSLYGPLMHRWGSAFPERDTGVEGLPFVSGRFGLAIAGDFGLEREGLLGKIEGAALSGMRAAEAVAKHVISRK